LKTKIKHFGPSQTFGLATLLLPYNTMVYYSKLITFTIAERPATALGKKRYFVWNTASQTTK